MKFNYSNKYNSKKNEDTEVEEELKDVEEKVTEDSTTELENTEDIIEESATEKIEDEEVFLNKAKIKNCELLNVRKEPKSDSEILFVINKENEILILEELEEFYKVSVNEKEGYCIKKYINIE